MPLFRVQLYEAGQWDGNPSHEVFAEDAQTAAEHVAHEKLFGLGAVRDFRASVWYAEEPHIPQVSGFIECHKQIPENVSGLTPGKSRTSSSETYVYDLEAIV